MFVSLSYPSVAHIEIAVIAELALPLSYDVFQDAIKEQWRQDVSLPYAPTDGETEIIANHTRLSLINRAQELNVASWEPLPFKCIE